MSSQNQNKYDIIRQIQQRLSAQLSPDLVKPVNALAYHFYRESISRELVQAPIDKLCGAIMSLWDFAQQRSNQPAIRAYNPTFEEHGWESRHTIIEIITTDQPFLVSSISMALNAGEFFIHRITHPVIPVIRDGHGNVTDIPDAEDVQANTSFEAVMRFEVARVLDQTVLDDMVQRIKWVLQEVNLAVTDWQPMLKNMKTACDDLAKASVPGLDSHEQQEIVAFLQWVMDSHFTFAGFRAYTLSANPQSPTGKMVLQADKSLGTFRNIDNQTTRELTLSPYLLQRMLAPFPLILTKSTTMSSIHRPAHLDYIGIKRFNKQGQVVGEWRFFGLYSSSAYAAPYQDIPLLRRKAQRLLDTMHIPGNSHKGKILRNILNHYPRDEMLQADYEQLNDTVQGILETQERRQLRLFIRPDIYGRFISALVFVPRDRYNTEVRMRMQEILLQSFNGHSVEFNVQFSEQVSARVHFTIHCENAHEQEYNIDEIEMQMTKAMLSWADNLHLSLQSRVGEAEANRLFRRYGNAFPAGYQADFTVARAAADIQHLESVLAGQTISTYLYRPYTSAGNLHFKVIGRGDFMALSDVLPILEHMGVKVLSAHPYAIKCTDCATCWILDFNIATISAIDLDNNSAKQEFQTTFIEAYQERIENDGFNKLVVAAALTCRQVVMLRAICKYLLQLKVPFSQAYMETTLANNPIITRQLVELFSQRFDPSQPVNEERCQELQQNIQAALDAVANLDEDRILRHYLEVILAMLRTNFYVQDKANNLKAYVSFKLAPERIPTAPQPRPAYEIFVYAPWVEGVHMRGSKVARGGLRWSDRREDFRTEILGLVKAQMVKNSVIVPSGAKGGFVAKRLPVSAEREQIQAEVEYCYRTFISGLLDITDNLVDQQLTPPSQVLRYDDDDPYLVVAADKGTATFSDLANEVAMSYGFWLGDAFASGGSNGYDHKKMGITARGAWESVKRLFKELSIDTQQQNFTCIGIGDMSGDVFGNGMLLSKHIRLIAAFNHQHIFIDPTPDAASSFVERQRLFNLPRSNWLDYDTQLISKGGGIYSRSAKVIELTTEAKQALGIEKQRLTPNELVKHILQAPVDLLWNGGIGTYVKASSETHGDVGDKANDSVRINANQLRCKVIGEGGNLGFTQLSRIEFARRGGLVTTDASDNSAGVDCSDHEVNIKIVVDQVVNQGDLTQKQRNKLLADMTDHVASLVLKHNVQQSQILSLINAKGVQLLNDQTRLLRLLEKEKHLKRKLEYLPNEDQLQERAQAQEGLTRPELSVLLAYSKIHLSDALKEEQIGSDPYFAQQIQDYFPSPLIERCLSAVEQHPLHNEIIASHVTNIVGNRMGPSFIMRVQEQANCSALSIVRAFFAATQLFNIDQIWQAVDQLTTEVSYPTQCNLYSALQEMTEKVTLWLLRHGGHPLDVEATVQKYLPGLTYIRQQLHSLLQGELATTFQQRVSHYSAQHVPESIAAACASLSFEYNSLDIVHLALQEQQDVNHAAQLFFALEEKLTLQWLRTSISALPQRNVWQRKARNTLADELDSALSQVTCHVQQQIAHEQEQILPCLDNWLAQKTNTLRHSQSIWADIQSSAEPDLAMLSVAVRELHNLA
ncbi:NAD-glutamate dehydrogenase [Zooshikella ganghwensis]|uniref:NAD-glutamate dehydrogenase n=1 Tax=Zooshikella ganghwensis TaxID=202772 RepID=A0A4P9VME8_9GAMM|nr:NAD-glutamate dehydrogenase [Zooshikella ganghwensis]RDH44568.1 NAD-glutamate dehydrogenase [Zooshikella ganghwensis]